MGGFASILGEAAQGYNEAAQKETQRTFAAEMDRRAQMVDLLGKLASDETAHLETRQAAFQQALDVLHTPHTKVAKPDFNKLITTAPSRPIASSQPPTQPFNVGDVPMPVTPPKVTLESPPSPPGMRYTPEEQTQMAASRIGAVTGAEAGAQGKFQVPTRNPKTGTYGVDILSGTGQPMASVDNAFNPTMMLQMMRGMIPVHYTDPETGVPMPGLQDKLGLLGQPMAIYDQNQQIVPNAQLFAPSLVPKVNTESMNARGEVTKKTTSTPVAPKGKGKPVVPQLEQPPAPPDLSMVAPGGPKLTAVPTPANVRGQSTAQPTKPTLGTPPTAARKSKPPVGSDEWIAKADPVSLDAWDWATQGRKPEGGAMAERQVRQRLAEMGLKQPAIPVPPAMQQKVQESFVARNSAIGLIDDILKNRQVLDGLLSSGKIAIASSPDGSGILSRAADLTDQEAQVAGDFQQLIEHANLLRGPLGATGFRGKEAWGALQAQRGRPMADPRITVQVMKGMRDRLVGLNSADKMVLGGQGMSGAAATGGRKLKKSAVDKAATDHGVDPAEAERQAIEQGYEIVP